MKTIILASVSPRRRDLLALLGLAFEVRASQVDESLTSGEPAEAFALRLARAKARTAAKSQPEDIVIAADTLVILDDMVLGKPNNEKEASEMLQALRGKVHRVISGLVVDGQRTIEELVETTVRMRNYSDQEIARYVGRGEPFDKAGAYAIQDREFQPVAEIGGCYANTMGLPICHLYLALVKLGRKPYLPADACQAFTGFTCSLFHELLSPGRGEPL